MNTLVLLLVLAIFLPIAVSGIIWLCTDHTIDKITHPEEWTDTGKSGERVLYTTLVHDFGIPEKQILRNVYIPTKKSETSEIDVLVLSKKGIFVFECKNYGGHIYGDARRRKWIQYLGNNKSYFYNPLMQNRNHVKHLKEYLGIDVPIVPLVTTITRGKWNIFNCDDKDLILGFNCHLKDIYNGMPESELMKSNFGTILHKLKPLSRPNKEVAEKHVTRIKDHHYS